MITDNMASLTYNTEWRHLVTVYVYIHMSDKVSAVVLQSP